MRKLPARRGFLIAAGLDQALDSLVAGRFVVERRQVLQASIRDGSGAQRSVQMAVNDVAEPAMRDVIDQIGGGYGWSGTIPSEWWHVEYGW